MLTMETKVCSDCGEKNNSTTEAEFCWRCWSKHPCPVCKSTGHSTPTSFCRAPQGCAAQGKTHQLIYPKYTGHGHPSEYDGGYCKVCDFKPSNIY